MSILPMLDEDNPLHGRELKILKSLAYIEGYAAGKKDLGERLRETIAEACREAGYDQGGEVAERFWKRIDAALGGPTDEPTEG